MEVSLRTLLIALVAGACAPDPVTRQPPHTGGDGTGTTTATTSHAEPDVAPAALHRLTDAQWRRSVEGLTSVVYEGNLPVDYSLHGFHAVGAGEITISPLDLEQYETAAWAVADAWIHDAEARDDAVGCVIGPALGEEDTLPDDASTLACVEAFTVALLRDAWRRPAQIDEIETMLDLYTDGTERTDATEGLRAVVAATLLSPHFLFQVELGEPLEFEPQRRRLTDHEIAARLALSLTGSPPDVELADAADAGELRYDHQVRRQATRLMDTEAAADTLTGFFHEYFGLDDVTLSSKDADLFPTWSDELAVDMQHETREVFREIALYEQRPLPELLTTNLTFLTPTLAAHYGVPTPTDPDGRFYLSGSLERGGVLGRGAFLAGNAHATLTSPTLRGKFVRSRLLCQDIPPPPPDVVASLDGIPNDGTLRDLLEVHMTDPACSSCHSLMDPIGFTLEHFDATGAWRELDNGFPIDASGEIDGVGVYGAAELGRAIARHPDLAGCMVRNTYRYVTGHLEIPSEVGFVDQATSAATNDGMTMHAVVGAVVVSEGFRHVGQPDGEACTTEGATRDCTTACGSGTETCSDGTWIDCTAPLPSPEECNDVDDDCDGEIDEVVLPCDDGGTSTCWHGTWQECDPPPTTPTPETCNGIDDDGDGLVDEDITVDIVQVPLATLTAAHEVCDDPAEGATGACRAAAHRVCVNLGCASTGLPVAWSGDEVALMCLSADHGQVITTDYATLGEAHTWCVDTEPNSMDCNASINRTCGSLGLNTGFGPVEFDGVTAYVACTPTSTFYETTYSALAEHVSYCNGITERYGPNCDEAFHRLCREWGHASGHGPLENSGDVAHAACVGER